jgi:hypothetical protein
MGCTINEGGFEQVEEALYKREPCTDHLVLFMRPRGRCISKKRLSHQHRSPSLPLPDPLTHVTTALPLCVCVCICISVVVFTAAYPSPSLPSLFPFTPSLPSLCVTFAFTAAHPSHPLPFHLPLALPFTLLPLSLSFLPLALLPPSCVVLCIRIRGPYPIPSPHPHPLFPPSRVVFAFAFAVVYSPPSSPCSLTFAFTATFTAGPSPEPPPSCSCSPPPLVPHARVCSHDCACVRICVHSHDRVISSASGLERGEVYYRPTDWPGSRDPLTPVRYTRGSSFRLAD